MSKNIIRMIAAVGVMTVMSLASASAGQRCTAHDRLVQEINAAYHTQFTTHCATASTSSLVARGQQSKLQEF